jgi:hypothetical protein
MHRGIQLSLMMGPIVPLPAPRLVIDALDRAEVTAAAGERSGFQLSFQFRSTSDLNTILLIAAAQGTSLGMPPLRVLLIVTLNGSAEPLFDGVMTNLEVQPGGPGQPGTLTLTGEDLTRVMDLIEWSGLPFPGVPVAARVALILAKYSVFGIVPLVIPPLFPDVPVPISKIPAQFGTDLAYINKMAREAGYVFYIEPGPVAGTNVGYFGPEIKASIPQPALNVDMDAHTNVESLSFSFDPTKGVLPVVYIQNKESRAPILIPIPDLNPLQPPLGAIPTPIAQLKILKDTAKLNPAQALSRGIAEAAQSQDAVTATGSLDVVRYGRLLKARRLVGVRGVGLAYNGLYYVQRVKTTLKRGELKQEFSLSRNGLVSITPRVPP